MKKLTISFEVKGYDLSVEVFEKGKFDEAEVRGKAEIGEYPYWEAPLKDYEFLHGDMGGIAIDVDLDLESVEEDFKKDFYAFCVDEDGPWGLAHEEAVEQFQYPIQYGDLYWDSMVDNGEKFYNVSQCFKTESTSFTNSDRWEMLKAIKNTELVVVLFSEYYKGPYTHSYSWNIDSDKFDFTKLCFHYGSSLSKWNRELSLPSDDWLNYAFLTVTYDGKEPDEWHIEPPVEPKGWDMIVFDGSEIEKLLVSEETGSK